MTNRFLRWLEELERQGVVKRREDVISSVMVLGCLMAAAGLIFLALAWFK